MKVDQYIQFGCGRSAPTSWRNFDASPTLRFERLPAIGKFYKKNDSRFPLNVEYGDIVKGLPVAPGSCRAVYCSHVLEHLALDEFRSALRNTYRILIRGGVFRLVVPDLEGSVGRYVNNLSPDAAIIFMKETALGRVTRSRNLMAFVVEWFGNSRHLWMWDYKCLEQELREVGFVKVRRARFGDASDPKFADVEDKERWDNCLGVECRK